MSKRYARQLHSADGLIAAVEQYGFLPFFRNEIHGFSIEELCPPELWFADDVDGPWEWKGPVARSGKCLYGKLFNKKAGFVIGVDPDLRTSGVTAMTLTPVGMTAWRPAKDKGAL
ncbi:MAG: hypothetical protein ACLS5Z_06340 [Clostridium fessum]